MSQVLWGLPSWILTRTARNCPYYLQNVYKTFNICLLLLIAIQKDQYMFSTSYSQKVQYMFSTSLLECDLDLLSLYCSYILIQGVPQTMLILMLLYVLPQLLQIHYICSASKAPQLCVVCYYQNILCLYFVVDAVI